MLEHWWQIALATLAGGLLVTGLLAACFWQTLYRLKLALSLFSGADQTQRFGRIAEIYPTSTVAPSNQPYCFPEGASVGLPRKFRFDEDYSDTADFLSETDTAALLILKQGEICFEQYSLTGGPDTPWFSWSMAKSFVSAMIGIAVAEGAIRSIEDPVTDYVQELKGSAYDGVRIKDILQMSSGASWNEDYSDRNSDINRFARVFAFGGSFTKFAASLKPARTPGKYKLYNSVDTEVLGLLLAAATGRSVTAYMQEKLWQPLGAETAANWILDSDNVEMSFGGLSATARDYAKLGELYRCGGAWQGRQIVPQDWVRASLTPDAPHLVPNAVLAPDAPSGYGQDLGYGYQWWVLDGEEGEFAAMGVYNQFIYVNPARGLTMVKLSANRRYGVEPDEAHSREKETLAFFRAVARSIGRESKPDDVAAPIRAAGF
ncbi:MAG: beta-lactamase family protein [Hyphomonadaceae bacterium]|nr:beta-lactamase family protein [Hyphomonadaceae bacterium]